MATPPEPVEIAGRPVGPGFPALLIAEAGVNHNGDPELAGRLVDAAADAGVDAVKFQTFVAERLASSDAPKAAYQLETTSPAESQLEMLRALELSAEDYGRLAARSAERGVLFLSTPFDEGSADLLDDLGVAAYKLGSAEVTNVPLLDHVAAKRKPVLLSTGMADLDEVAAAVDRLRGGGGEVIVLHCVSAYPADPAQANLRAMAAIAERCGCPVGFSDHTVGIETALAAVALGAAVIEKHVTLDRTLPGPDHAASVEPDELAALVRGVRLVESALGDGVKRPAAGEGETARVVRRSLAAAVDLAEGSELERSSLTTLRPATGIPPTELDSVLGRRLVRALRRGEILRPSDLA